MPRLARFIAILLAAFGFWGPPPARAAEAEDILKAVVQVRAEIPSEARTARFLGTRRDGSGVVIDSHGLVLTIGYLILEAMAASVVDAAGRDVPAEVVAYDYDTGFGLLRAREPLDAVPIRMGDSDAVKIAEPYLAVGYGGRDGVTPTFVTARKPFAGYWEYLIESAIFTAPAHPRWAGAALISPKGRLVGIGSLRVPDAAPGNRKLVGNMFVPINLLKPILGDLLAEGHAAGPPRPWLGMFTGEDHGKVMVTDVIPEGPAATAGVREGDRVLEVAGAPVLGMSDLFRKIWALGEAGVEVSLTVQRHGETRAVVIRSIDRYDYLRLNPSY